MSYKNLEIWQEARAIAIEVHEMTLKDLPSFEMYETGGKYADHLKVPGLRLWKDMAEDSIRLNILNF